MIKQTAGRDQLGEFAPKFAQLNDDVLFGEVWNREGLSPKLRSILTVTVLVSKGLVDSSFQYHMTSAKQNGVTKNEMAEILTHVAFYAGWPNAWAAFRAAVEVYKEDAGTDGGLFGVGAPNDAYAQYFTGRSYLKPLTNPQETVFMANVTFEPGCRNNWHIHRAARGGGQILLCTSSTGTARPATAGSAMWRWSAPARRRPTNGWSRWMTPSTGNWAERSAGCGRATPHARRLPLYP